MKLKPIDEAKWDARAKELNWRMPGTPIINFYRDRSGRPITTEQWVARHDREYKTLFRTTVGRIWVSTIWMGVDNSIEGIPFYGPSLFETAVFGWDRRRHRPIIDDVHEYMFRWDTEEEAVRGHNRISRLVLQKKWKWGWVE